MAEARIDFRVRPGGTLIGQARVPGDKSISHRAIVLGGISEGQTRISGFLEGEDTLATLAAFEAMGIRISRNGAEVVLEGRGLYGLERPGSAIDLGNSGTAMRLMAGLMAGQRFDSTLTGDSSLSSRPMKRIIDPLHAMGAKISAAHGNTAPLSISGGRNIVGIRYVLPMASAQVKSCVLLAGLYAKGRTVVVEPATTRDHTERMLQGFGYEVETGANSSALQGGGCLTGCDMVVPADLSSAAFFMVGGCIASGGRLTLEGVGLNPTRDGVVRILQAMGAQISTQHHRVVGGEPVADVSVLAGPLTGIDIPPDWVSLAIDEFPVLMVAAAAAQGVTTVRGAAELRVKESDRIAAMADGLTRLGIHCETAADGMTVHGGEMSGGQVCSFGDHRIAMAFTVAALGAGAEIVIEDCSNVATSFPGFVELANSLGMDIAVDRGRPS